MPEREVFLSKRLQPMNIIPAPRSSIKVAGKRGDQDLVFRFLNPVQDRIRIFSYIIPSHSFRSSLNGSFSIRHSVLKITVARFSLS